MKLDVTIDLDDMFPGTEDESLGDVIKSYIITHVKVDILNTFRADIQTKITDVVKQQVQESKEFNIEDLILKSLKDRKIKKSNYSDEMLTVEEYINSVVDNVWLDERTLTKQVNNIIDARSTKVVDELRARYDMMFASKIINKLNENKMLRDDVASMLLEDNKEKH